MEESAGRRFTKEFVAGAATGVVQVVVGQPFDIIKVSLAAYQHTF